MQPADLSVEQIEQRLRKLAALYEMMYEDCRKAAQMVTNGKVDADNPEHLLVLNVMSAWGSAHSHLLREFPFLNNKAEQKKET